MPFVDVTIVEADETNRGCPASHPDELIFEVWPGITGMCDCLEREEGEGREYYLHRECKREGKDSPEKSEDCLDLRGRNPIVQNVLKGARYCGKRGGVAFKDAIRPVYSSST